MESYCVSLVIDFFYLSLSLSLSLSLLCNLHDQHGAQTHNLEIKTHILFDWAN